MTLALTDLLAAIRDHSRLPADFACEVPVDDAAILAAQLAQRGFTCQHLATEPGRMTTLFASGQRFSGAVDVGSVP